MRPPAEFSRESYLVLARHLLETIQTYLDEGRPEEIPDYIRGAITAVEDTAAFGPPSIPVPSPPKEKWEQLAEEYLKQRRSP